MNTRSKTKCLRMVGSAAFGLASLALSAVAATWPAWADGVLHSRPAVGFFAAWCGGSVFLLHPGLRGGLAHGIREFRTSAEEVARQIGDDDDDPPQSA